MDWDRDYDMKEYRPRRQRKIGADGRELPSMLGITQPDALTSAVFLHDAVKDTAPLTGAAAMQTSEILDFAEGN